MMDRRNFLRMLGATAVVAAAPKFIFDMGANLYRRESQIVTPEFVTQIRAWASHSISPVRPIQINGTSYYALIVHPKTTEIVRATFGKDTLSGALWSFDHSEPCPIELDTGDV